ncbi:phage HK022 GP20-like protein [Alcaligenes faecalis subsp. faecalis NCIB 8687]|nr:phage HK022 GP20-like protein [Alcaligenes faecalis subsp. faecalis NCIB 8687]
MIVATDIDDELRTVRLYGKLGARFGRVHRLAVNSVAEAIRALCVLFPGFEREMMTSGDRGMSYACFLAKTNINEETLQAPAGQDEIRIAPVIRGAKRGGVFQTVLGVALVAAAFMIPGLNAAVAMGMLAAGVGMAIGGVFQMLAPTQQGLSTADRPENGASYNFNGPVNTTAQGNPVPLGYGKKIVGSAVVSAGIYSEDQM